MSNLANINEALTSLPSIKARLAEELGILEVEEKKVRGLAFLKFKNQEGKPTVAEVEAQVDSSPEVIAKAFERAKKEAQFHKAKDELEAAYELARNLRAEMRSIEPSV